MRTTRATVLLIISLLMLSAPPAHAYTLPKPQLIAVYFWASWCPNCKALTPLLEEARQTGALDTKPVLFVKFDLSDTASIHQSILLAQALGLASYLQAQGSSTGYVALLDAATKKELQRFDRTTSAAAIASAIAQQLAVSAPAPVGGAVNP